MTRAEKLEKELRRWTVGIAGGRFSCSICTGKWSLYENKMGVERHTTSCVLFRVGFKVAAEPPEIPF